MHRIAVLIGTVWTTCAGASAPPAIDGFLDDLFWSCRDRVWTTYRPDQPGHSACFHLGSDSAAVYFAADVTDPDVTGTLGDHLVDATRDDSVQLFIDVADATAADYAPRVFQYGFSAAGAANWYRIDDPVSQPAESRPATWDSAVRWMVTLKPGTTLNEPGNRDRGYIVEASIPWQEFGLSQPQPRGRTIGVCFVNTFKAGETAEGVGILPSSPDPPRPGPALPHLWQRVRIGPPEPLALRGLTESLPLWLGTTMYADQWQGFASAETDSAGPWFNRDRWKNKLDGMASLGYNALLLLHPHPYAGLLPLEHYPGACYFTPETLARHMDQFRWLLAEAKARGIRVYLLTWNICLPPQWASANNLPEFGADTPLTRAYTRQAVHDLFATYPDLSGLATMAAESPPGCTDFVAEAIVGGLSDLRKSRATRPAGTSPDSMPELIFWNWCSYPQDARRIIEAYPQTRLMDYLQYEQWFKPMVDPRVPRFATWATAGPLRQTRTATPSFVLGGPKSSLGYLFWGDPDWLRQTTIDMRRQGIDGVFFETYCEETWLAQEALAYYAAHAEESFDAARWSRRLDEIYGVGEHAAQLLEAMQHASAIVPRLLALVHSQSDHFMPQFGLSLAHYLEMPTLSSYVFENTQTLDERGYLTPKLGLTWPNPGWGEQVASIREDTAGAAPPGATRPRDIVREIELHVMACRARLASLRQIEPPAAEQTRRLAGLMSRLELNAALGEHFGRKIRAAIGWARLKAGGAKIEDCTGPLEESVHAWQKVCEITDRLYQTPVRYWQSQIVSPPPWTQNRIWQDYRLVKGHWCDQLPRFQRELSLVRNSLAISVPKANLPMWDHLDADPDENLVSLHRITFHNNAAADPRLSLGPGTGISNDRQFLIGEAATLVADTRSLGDGHHEILRTNPQSVTLHEGMFCQITTVYRVIHRGDPEAIPFEIGVRPNTGGPPLGTHRYWGAPDGHVGTRVLKVPPPGGSDHVFYISIHGRAAVAIDLINIQTRKTP